MENRGAEYRLLELPVLRETRCYWFVRESPWSSKERQVDKGAKRPWAYQTVEEARESYLHRKFRAIEHCRHRLNRQRALFSNAVAEFQSNMKEPPEEWFEGSKHAR